jgi:hypothetical protein
MTIFCFIKQQMGEFAKRNDGRPMIKPSKVLSLAPQQASRRPSVVQAESSDESSVLAVLQRKLHDANEQIVELTKENMKLAGQLKIRDHELNRDARLIDTHRGFSDDDIDSSGAKGGSLRDSTGGGANSARLHQIMAAESHNR